MDTDCLIIGYNDGCLEDEIRNLRAMGLDHPNYRDLSLNIIEYEGRPYRAMDIFNRFYYEGRVPTGNDRRWHNADVLWMVIMYLGTYLRNAGAEFVRHGVAVRSARVSYRPQVPGRLIERLASEQP